MVLKALLFGIDGLISNINQINYFVWQKVLQEYGYKLTYQDYLQLFLFEHAPNLLIVLLPYCTIDEHTTIVKAKEDAFLQLISEMDSSQLHLAPGLLQFISSCQGTDTTIVAVSDLPIKQTTALLEKLHLDQLVRYHIASSRV
jgi:beta-phosphoglucomutase-like phosphatase (HAD superfamily)